MTTTPTLKKVQGKVRSINLSGYDPNSGELTLVICPTIGAGENSYASIVDDHRHHGTIEHGVFAGYVATAVTALSDREGIECTHVEGEKPRIAALRLAPTTAT
jgi:hypothetical protein